MNLDITMMEIKRLRKSLLIGIVAPVAYSALIMVFYIAFAGVFEDMSSVFESAALQGLLRAFSMDANTFAYILSYYVSYNGVYMLLMGIIFSATYAVKLFSKELNDGTYEFIYANPISRVKVFVSKSLVIIIYLVVLNLLVFLVGFVSLEALKTKSPIIPWMSEGNVEILKSKLEDDPSRIDYFIRDDKLFYDIIYSNLENQYTMASDVTEMDTEVVNDMLTVFLMNPDGIFDELIANKDKYMVLFEMTPGQEEEFVRTINAQKEAYFTVKNQFKDSPLTAVELFKNNPKPFLNNIKTKEDVDSFSEVFNLSDKESKQVFIYYSLPNYIKLSITTFLVMLAIGLFIMMVVVVVPKGHVTSGIATGIGIIFYMMNMMASIAEPIEVVKYFTPLSYINMDVMNVNYQTDAWALITLVIIYIVSYVTSVMVMRKKDLIA